MSNELLERQLLGCCLLDGKTAVSLAIASGVTPASFQGVLHNRIFTAMMDAQLAGMETTPDAVVHAMDQHGWITAETCQEINQVARSASTTANLRPFIAALRTAELARAVSKAGGEIGEMAQESHIDPDELVSKAQSRLSEALQWSPAERIDWRHQVSRAVATLQNPGQTGLSLGFHDLDRAFGPLMPSHLVIIGARPSVGKSSYLRHIIAHHCRAGRRIFVASLETTAEEIAIATAKTLCGAPDNREAVCAAMQEIASWELAILDDFGAWSDTIIAKARSEHSRKPLDLLCVDHLHLLPDAAGQKNVTMTDAIGRITKNFKALAGELNIPVLLLSQLSRDPAKNNRAPRMEDLRSSGSLDQDADKIILLHRPDKDQNSHPQDDTDDIDDRPRFYTRFLQVKGRSQGTAEVAMLFNRRLTRFEPIAFAANA